MSSLAGKPMLDPAAIAQCFRFFHLLERSDEHLRGTKVLEKEVVQRLLWTQLQADNSDALGS